MNPVVQSIAGLAGVLAVFASVFAAVLARRTDRNKAGREEVEMLYKESREQRKEIADLRAHEITLSSQVIELEQKVARLESAVEEANSQAKKAAEDRDYWRRRYEEIATR